MGKEPGVAAAGAGGAPNSSSQQQDHSSSNQQFSNAQLFTSDEFRMYCMKVLPCSKRFVHDWTQCPFAHPGEKAKRRDPRTHQYDCEMCPSVAKGEACELGNACPHSHHVFESWLHPQKYRTLLCKDGDRCYREVCFFAHGTEQLRTPDRGPATAAHTRAPAGGRRSFQQPAPSPAAAAVAGKQRGSRPGRSALARADSQTSSSAAAAAEADGAGTAAAPSDKPSAGERQQQQPPQPSQHQRPSQPDGCCVAEQQQQQEEASPEVRSLIQTLLQQVQASKQEAAESRMAAATTALQLQAMEQALGHSSSADAATLHAAANGASGPAAAAPQASNSAPLAAAAQAVQAAHLLGASRCLGWPPPLHYQQQLAGYVCPAAGGPVGPDDCMYARRYSLDETLLHANRGRLPRAAASPAAMAAAAGAAAGAGSSTTSSATPHGSPGVWSPGAGGGGGGAANAPPAAAMQLPPTGQCRTSRDLDLLAVAMAHNNMRQQQQQQAAAAAAMAAASCGFAYAAPAELAALPHQDGSMLAASAGASGPLMLPAASAAAAASRLALLSCAPGAAAAAGAAPWGLLAPGCGGYAGGLPVAALGYGGGGGAVHSHDAAPHLGMQALLGHQQQQAAGPGACSLSAPQLQSDYLVQLHQALQGAGALGASSAASSPPLAQWEELVYPQSALAAALTATQAGTSLPQAAADAGCAGAGGSGCALGFDGGSGCGATEQASGALPACDLLAGNPIGGANQLGWF